MIISKQKKKGLDNSHAKLLLLRSKRVHSQNETIKGSLRVEPNSIHFVLLFLTFYEQQAINFHT